MCAHLAVCFNLGEIVQLLLGVLVKYTSMSVGKCTPFHILTWQSDPHAFSDQRCLAQSFTCWPIKCTLVKPIIHSTFVSCSCNFVRCESVWNSVEYFHKFIETWFVYACPFSRGVNLRVIPFPVFGDYFEIIVLLQWIILGHFSTLFLVVHQRLPPTIRFLFSERTLFY